MNILVRNNITVAALLNLVLNLVLIPYYGVLGAALATAISLAVKNLLAAYLVWNRLRIQTIPSGGAGKHTQVWVNRGCLAGSRSVHLPGFIIPAEMKNGVKSR